jgi:hypothetical protein
VGGWIRHRLLGAEGRRENSGQMEGEEAVLPPLPGVLRGLLAFVYTCSSSTPHVLGTDRGVRALPIRVRGWTATATLDHPTMKGRVNGLRIGGPQRFAHQVELEQLRQLRRRREDGASRLYGCDV